MAEQPHGDITIFKRFLHQARPYWWHIVGIFLLGLLATPLALLMPIPLKIAVDSVLGSEAVPGFISVVLPDAALESKGGLLIAAAVLQVTFVLLTQLQSMGSYVLSTYTGEQLTLTFRAKLFRHIQRLSFTFHDTRGTSDSIYRIQYDTPSIQHIMIFGLIPLVSSILQVVAMLVVTMLISWELALVALSVTPILFVFIHMYRLRMRGQYRSMKRLESQALNVVQEVLTALRVVKAFGREDSEQERFVENSSAGVRARIRISLAEGFFGLLVNIVTAIGTAAVLYVGIRTVMSGAISLGELLIVITYLSQLYTPLKTFSNKTATLQSSLASAQRALELLDEVPDVTEKPHARTLVRAKGNLSFNNVSFGYSEDSRVLHDISFVVSPNCTVGIAGKTGAGKSTLVNLITRFYDPDSGNITLDGVDLRDYKLSDLQNQFAIVLQEPVLFSTTVRENIAYAKPESGIEEIVTAAKAAEAHDFISSLPQGYDTQVGERGLKLSGGERQRISLARAFLKDAPILLLDEPTSSIDMKTEADIIRAMNRLMKNRTTFMIAHRLTTLENCDVLLLLEGGKLTVIEDRVTEKIADALGREGVFFSLEKNLK